MEEKLITTLQKAPLGSFGVNEDRFKDKSPSRDVPGPGSYKLKESKDVKKVPNTHFKSNTKRYELVNKGTGVCLCSVAQSPPPGSYDQNAYTIADRCKQEEEDDPELAIRKPPFGVGEKRWRDNVKGTGVGVILSVIEEEDEDFFNNERSTNDLFRKKPNNVPPFHSRERRFNYSADNNPGPGEYYDGMNPQWNKRTFNIIFAEI